jgi:hypothetical protein
VTLNVTVDQQVAENAQYVACQGGEFEAEQLVLCRRKDEANQNTCAFLAQSVAGISNEG